MDHKGEIAVEYEMEGEDTHVLALGSSGLPKIRIDYAGVPADQRTGTATSLLCASALYCFASTLAAALKSRGARVKGLTGRASLAKERDHYGKTRVAQIHVDVYVDVDEQDLPIVEKCTRILRDGCLITYSLGEGIGVVHSVQCGPRL